MQIIFYLSCLSACNFYCIFHSTIPQWAKQYAIKSISHLILNTMGFKPCGALCSSWTRTMCARDVIVGEKIGQRNLLSNLQPDIDWLGSDSSTATTNSVRKKHNSFYLATKQHLQVPCEAVHSTNPQILILSLIFPYTQMTTYLITPTWDCPNQLGLQQEGSSPSPEGTRMSTNHTLSQYNGQIPFFFPGLAYREPRISENKWVPRAWLFLMCPMSV